MKKYYIDLDYTMLDTTKFHDKRRTMLQSYGISIEEQKDMEKYISQEEKRLMNLDYLCTKLCERHSSLPREEILSKIHKIIGDCYMYLYDDTIEFLEYLKSKGDEANILTWGDKSLQEEKIKGTKLEPYMNKVIITEELKYLIDIDYENGIFIDDNPRDLEGLYRNNPEQVIRMKRERAKYSECPLNINIKEYKSFRDLKHDLEQEDLQKQKFDEEQEL
ncbi:MAG: HAD hydrolase-like protein [Clostridia bacterium]|nr:HAD hydrolase-like protein [Clostridia bacterium]